MALRKISLIGLFAAFVILSGCTSKVVKTESLHQQNRYAIVSVTGISSGFGLSEDEEEKLITSVEKVVAKELKAAKGFKLVQSSKVLRNRHYKAIKGESTEGLMTMKAAKGYKKFDIENETKNLAKLRKDLKLSGVIQVASTFTKKSGGMWISGILPIPLPISTGSTSGEVMLTVVAYDSNNEVVWQDTITTETKDSVGTVMGIGNLSSLHPQLIDAAQVAANTAVRDLNTELK